MKAVFSAVGLVLILAFIVFIINSNSTKKEDKSNLSTKSATPMSNPTKKQYEKFPGVLPESEYSGKKVTISTAKGDIVIELLSDAPKAASNFVFLVKEGFYDGLTFHRREESFVIQGGDPNGNGTGGPGYKFEDDPVTRNYDRGIVSMANAGPNTNGSQFFIMLSDNPTLPKNYSIFGKVVSGMDVVDKIQVGDVMQKATVD